MKFVDEEHKAFYEQMVAKTRTADDQYRAAMFYAFGLTSMTRTHINEIYDFAEHCPRFGSIRSAWQTSTSARVMRLAFNLFNGYDGNRTDRHDAYTPDDIFADGLMEYMFEAIRIRHPEYTGARQEAAQRFMAVLESEAGAIPPGTV